MRKLIREAQIREYETIRAKLIEAEQSGFSDRTAEQIWEEARRRRKAEPEGKPDSRFN